MEEMQTILDQDEVFGHTDKRFLFIVGRNDDADILVNMVDVSGPVSRLIGTSKPIQDLVDQEIVEVVSDLKETGLAIVNGYPLPVR